MKLARVSRMIARVATEDATRAAVSAAIRASGQGDTEISRALDHSRQGINNYRKGKSTIPLDTAVELARYLRISVDQLAGAAPLPSRSPELAEALLAVRELATAQGGIANQLQDVAELLSRLEGPAVDDRAAGTG